MPTRRKHVDWTPERIRSEREEARLTQRQLAALLDVSPSVVSQWETGRHEPHAGHQADLTRILIEGEAVAPLDERVRLLETELRELREQVAHLAQLVDVLARR